MQRMSEFLRRLSVSYRRGRIEQEIDEELRFHLEQRVRAGLDAGLTLEEAEVEARRRFGDYERIRASCREISRERLEREMPVQMIKGLIWVMLGCGIVLKLGSDIRSVRQVGIVLMMISILWRALLYLRGLRPSGGRSQELVLSLADEAARKPVFEGLADRAPVVIPARDRDGRTPVERLLAEDD